MLHGIPQVAGNVLLGVAGVTVLAASANAVAILAEAVRRASVQLYDAATGNDSTKTATDNSWGMRALVPYCGAKDWTTLGTSAVKNIIVGTVALYVANRFCPSLVTNANSLLHRAVGIQFTPHHIPITKFFGL